MVPGDPRWLRLVNAFAETMAEHRQDPGVLEALDTPRRALRLPLSAGETWTWAVQPEQLDADPGATARAAYQRYRAAQATASRQPLEAYAFRGHQISARFIPSFIEPRAGITVVSDGAWYFRVDDFEVPRPPLEDDVQSELEAWARLIIDTWRKVQDFACPVCGEILVEDSTVLRVKMLDRVKCENPGCALEWPGRELDPVG